MLGDNTTIMVAAQARSFLPACDACLAYVIKNRFVDVLGRLRRDAVSRSARDTRPLSLPGASDDDRTPNSNPRQISRMWDLLASD
jgi:hypothetical protein